MLPLPHEYINTLCEIKSMTNEMLAIGHIIKIDTRALEISAQDDTRMPLLQYRTSVKLFVHSAQFGPQILAGSVYLSTENFVRIEEVKPLQDFERRGAFRVNAQLQALLYPLLNEEEQAVFDTRIESATPAEAIELLASSHTAVRLMDISLTGIRLSSPTPLQSGVRYLIEFTPLTLSMTFCMNMQRVIQTPSGDLQYGCSFFDYGERQLDALCKELFQLQRMEKVRRQNAPV